MLFGELLKYTFGHEKSDKKMERMDFLQDRKKPCPNRGYPKPGIHA
jgi:hypothetical protein